MSKVRLTFPFPPDWECVPELEAACKEYYDFRAGLMVGNDEGLWKTNNRFHDPDETDPSIIRLRELHSAMDRAVLGAYGFVDLDNACDFHLEYAGRRRRFGREAQEGPGASDGRTRRGTIFSLAFSI